MLKKKTKNKNWKERDKILMKQPCYNTETETAMQEARDIISGKKKAKKYSSADELFNELNAKYQAKYNKKGKDEYPCRQGTTN